MGSWYTVSRIKKCKYITIQKNKTRYNLKNYTNGVPWKGSEAIVGINGLDTKNMVYSALLDKQKINDDTFDLGLTLYSRKKYTRSSYEVIKDNTTFNTIVSSNMVDYCYFQFYFLVGGIIPRPDTLYTTWNAKIYVNGKLELEVLTKENGWANSNTTENFKSNNVEKTLNLDNAVVSGPQMPTQFEKGGVYLFTYNNLPKLEIKVVMTSNQPNVFSNKSQIFDLVCVDKVNNVANSSITANVIFVENN